MKTIHVAHSPDADDAFMFWALAAGKIDTGDRRYVHELGDIESLNRRALNGELEVSAVSFHAYAYLAHRYALLAHGASIGDRYGPRLVARTPPPGDPRRALEGRRVAVPGELTTAFLVLRLYQPTIEHVVVPFDQIEDWVAESRGGGAPTWGCSSTRASSPTATAASSSGKTWASGGMGKPDFRYRSEATWCGAIWVRS